MRYRVVFDPAADADLAELYDYIAPKAGRAIARRYVNELLGHCAAFETFPARGTKHDEFGPGIRVVGFKRKASIVFRIDADLVTIMRILHRGKSLTGANDIEDDEF
ncbi:type II toxin-antitoxin system RelE/ParE family toxin [Neorhizobium tomejilense]|uniref:type II toxin-antitoxin system RelE/ParE family toxin n=1 Tax=Neorhizobium tomejilense TaxID=2093828 RepID=UPI003ED143A8